MKLRNYQRRAIDSLDGYWREKKGSHPIIVAGTGSGNSVIQAFFIKETIKAYPTARILCVTHVKELIEQNHERFHGIWHDAPSGVYSAGLKRRDDAQIMFAGIQSIYKKAFDFDKFDLLMVDEAHLIPKKGTGMYKTFIDNLLMVNPKMKIIGLTASPFRLDGGSLIAGDGALFDGLSCHITIKELIEQHFLTPLTAKEGIAHIETSKLTTQNGEYRTADVEKAFAENSTTDLALSEVIELGKERKSWMVFCTSVKHCNEVAEKLNERGIPTIAVHGELPPNEREKAIGGFKNYEYRCIVSVNILTTGFDVEQVDMIALMRSTQSASLYLQICGRGMRLCEGKSDCLVLDFGENILNHGAVDEIVERQLEMGGRRKGKKGEPVLKRCPSCEFMCFAATRICPNCGDKFDISTLPKIQQEAARLAILSSEREKREEWFDVTGVTYDIHNKPGKPSSMKVSYFSGNLQSFSEWICLDHQGFARKKAVQWIKERADVNDSLLSTEEMVRFGKKGKIREPDQIKVLTGRKYPEIVGFSFV